MSRFRSVGILVTVLSLLALVVATYSGWRYREYARCQGQVNEVMIVRSRILTEVLGAERVAERRRDDALDAVLADPALSKPVGDRTPAERERVLNLYAEYLKARRALVVERAKADLARAANPVPAPPSQTCRP